MKRVRKTIISIWNKCIQSIYVFQGIEIYTDGGVKNERGAWAYVLVKNSKVILEAAAPSDITDCNQMELQAAIEALKALKKKTRAIIHSDSRVLIDSVTLWMKEWHNNNWRKKNGAPIPYVEQLKELYELNQLHNLSWKWVRSHSGNSFNQYCDDLCRQVLTK
jgi:ribonuclease HI